MVGETIDRFEILELRQPEASGPLVYKGRDVRLNRLVSVVELPGRPGEGYAAKRLRFMEDAWAATALNHPHVLTMMAVVAGASSDCAVYEYVRGRTLDRWISRNLLGPSRVLKFALHICEALESAHSASIAHGCLCPSSVHISETGKAKLFHFGYIHLLESAEGAHDEAFFENYGRYLAPEQRTGQPAAEPSDIFSFGCLMYEMDKRRPAFATADSAMPPELADAPVKSLLGIVARCLQPDPGQRFASFAELRHALERASLAGPAPAPTPSPVTPKPVRDANKPAPAAMPPQAVDPKPRRRRRAEKVQSHFQHWGLVLGTLACVAAASIAYFTYSLWPRPDSGQEITDGAFHQITNESGLVTDPSVTPDGSTMVFASDVDTGENLEIYVQKRGRDRFRLTTNSVDDYDPRISPDGNLVAYRSEQEPRGIYVIPVAGGIPKLLAADGRSPRFSPAGDRIAYWVGSQTMTTSGAMAHSFMVPVGGGTPVPLAPQLKAAANPVWSPDGMNVVVAGWSENAEQPDWWIAPVSGGAPPRNTGIPNAILQHNIRAGRIFQWLAHPDRLIFAHIKPGISQICQVQFNPATGTMTAVPEPLTNASEIANSPSISSAGEMVFAKNKLNVEVWKIAVDTEHPSNAGLPQRVTDSQYQAFEPSLSRDGLKLTYTSNKSGEFNVWLKEVASGKESLLTAQPTRAIHPVISPDGSQIAFGTVENRKESLFLIPSAGGPAKVFCDGCGYAAWHLTDGGKQALYFSRNVKAGISLVDVESGKKTVILESPNRDLFQGGLSPDGKWITFLASRGADATQIFVAPFRGHTPVPEREWIPITAGNAWDSKHHWSPDGATMFFASSRDGFRCLWAQRLDPDSHRPLGEPFAVSHSHSIRRSMNNVVFGDFEIAVGHNVVAFSEGEISGNLWRGPVKTPGAAQPSK